MVQESLQISVKVNFRDKNFVIALNFHDLMLPVPRPFLRHPGGVDLTVTEGFS